jgi:hypothetical protein
MMTLKNSDFDQLKAAVSPEAAPTDTYTATLIIKVVVYPNPLSPIAQQDPYDPRHLIAIYDWGGYLTATRDPWIVVELAALEAREGPGAVAHMLGIREAPKRAPQTRAPIDRSSKDPSLPLTLEDLEGLI